MMFSKYFLLLCFFSIYVSFANEPLTIRLSLIGNDTIVFNKLAFGFHSEATNGLDTALGELDLPPLLPPSGYKLYGVFIFYDSTQGSNIWSYLDLRPFPAKSNDTVKFLLYAIRESGIKLRIYWNTIPDNIRYAWLVDEYLGTLVQVDMKKTNYVNIQNEFLDKFYIKMVFEEISQVEEDNSDEFEISYIPLQSEVIIRNKTLNQISLRIFDIYGKLVQESNLSNESTFSSNNFPKGIYFVEFNYLNGRKVVRKLIIY
ncbi:T9SS C-terminal target domain-containing protein [Bacteroidetes/Chlorobi group bacterium Naka2016]|nr:MAG: T9SS C-terminal target domain-containing protein [Bacteroidetes/Chlorobi group bacterium Naka2016]